MERRDCCRQAGLAQPWALSAAAFCLGAGVVMVMLAVFALVPGAVERQRLSRANALLEFCRAIVCIAAPLIAAQFAARGLGALAFALAGAAAIGGLLAVRALPQEAPRAAAKTRFLEAIREGAVFVAKQPVLRAIALCAIAWNAAFFALTAVFVPHAVKLLQLNTESIGAAWSVYGAGLLGGAIAAPFMIGRLHTGAVFAFGPLLSVFSALLLLTAAAPGRLCPVYMAFFCIGFGPMTWLVLQTSVRQIVTPPELMGRVGATISTAIYGVRPLGALLAGAVAAQFGTGAAIACTAGLFALSALAILLAPATRAISLRR